MVVFFKRKKLEKYIDYFINNFCNNYPFYMHNLYKNIELSKTLIELYNTLKLPTEYTYKSRYSVEESISLTSQILESISPYLRDRFIEEIKKGVIVYKEVDYSYLEFEHGKYSVVINDTKDIIAALSSVHEFFHLLHLEQVNYDGENNNYYCYTEALGMTGEIYSIIYILNNMESLKEDALAYLYELIYRLNCKANSTLIDGMLISIYDEENSLSRKAIKNYVNKFNVSKDYLDILKYKLEICLDYYDDVRYIYSLPQALVMSYRLFYEEDFRNNFANILSELSKMSYVKWADRYFNSYIKDETKLLELFKLLQDKINELYSNNKVKKIGEL